MRYRMKQAKRYYRMFECDICGVHRIAPKKHKTAIGHIKHMYCPICKDVTSHTQLTEE